MSYYDDYNNNYNENSIQFSPIKQHRRINKENTNNSQKYEKSTDNEYNPPTHATTPPRSVKSIKNGMFNSINPNADIFYVSSDITNMPHPKIFKSVKLPIGICYNPMSPINDELPLPLINSDDYKILRCISCKAYLNPFDEFTLKGRYYKCALCGADNEVPSYMYCGLNEYGIRKDITQHPELMKGQVEYKANSEYMLRPPQSPVFIFVIELTRYMTNNIIQTIFNSINLFVKNIENKRTQIAIITFNSAIQLYNFNPKKKHPEIIQMNNEDGDDFLPIYDTVLCQISEIESLLTQLFNSFNDTIQLEDLDENNSCLGSVLKCAYNIGLNTGGKVMLFLSEKPNVGKGRLDEFQIHSDIPSYGGERLKAAHSTITESSNSYYYDLSQLYVNRKLSCDIFYIMSKDHKKLISSIMPMITSTGGHIYYFNYEMICKSDSELYNTIYNNLTMEIGWEAVLGIRISKGYRIKQIYGNHNYRKVGLINLANVNRDTVLTFEIEGTPNIINDSVKLNKFVIQFGLIYTNSFNERRVRVHTYSLPITINPVEVYEGIITKELVGLYSKKCIYIIF